MDRPPSSDPGGVVLAESSSESSNLIGGVGFVFRFAGGSAAEDGTGRSDRRTGGILLGTGKIGGCSRGEGPCAGCKVPKIDAGYWNRLRCGDAYVIPCDWFNTSWNPGVWVKVAGLLTDSMYALAVFDRGGTGRNVLDSRSTSTGEATGGDGIAEAGSTGRGGVSETFVKNEAGVSGTVVGMGASVGTSSGCALPASLVLASDHGACLSPDSANSWLVLRAVGVWRFCNTFVGGRSGNFERFGTFSSGTGLLQKKQFWASKRALISAKLVSILAE